MDWEKFKSTEFAVKCTSGKEKFFSECERHGIYNFMSEGAMSRDYFICRLCYKDRFSEGRYELRSVEEWQIKDKNLYGKYILEVVNYD